MLFRRGLVPGASNELGECLTMQLLSIGYLRNGSLYRNEIWHKGSLGDEDDAQTSNTLIVQRKHITTLDNEKYDVHCTDGAL